MSPFDTNIFITRFSNCLYVLSSGNYDIHLKILVSDFSRLMNGPERLAPFLSTGAERVFPSIVLFYSKF